MPRKRRSKKHREAAKRFWDSLSAVGRYQRSLRMHQRYKDPALTRALPDEVQTLVDRLTARGIDVVDVQQAVGKHLWDKWILHVIDGPPRDTIVERYDAHAEATGFEVYEFVARQLRNTRVFAVALLIGPYRTPEQETEEIRRAIEGK